MLFQAYLGKKSPKFFPAGPFIRIRQIKCLSRCPYFHKPPLPWKITGYAPEYKDKMMAVRNYRNIYLVQLELGKENSDNMSLEIWI